jgi:hypothetical protein
VRPNRDAQNGKYRFAVINERVPHMPLLIHSTPKYRHHRASGNAVVKIQGKDHYLGKYGSNSARPNTID